MTKKKKVSIREFVSEPGLKFQLYFLKYSNQLKTIEEKTEEEIRAKWDYDSQKKINRFRKDATKVQFQNDIAQEAIRYNIEYVQNLEAPIKASQVLKAFEIKRADYIMSLEERIEENSTATLVTDKQLLEYAKTVELTAEVSKEKFGQMLLLIIKNLATMPSFSGYSDNWKTDFFSNAIEKTLLYLDNFDEELLSKRTGSKSNAFAYITQICFNAFVNIINIRKKEDEFLKHTISLESVNLDGVKHYNNDNKIEEEIIPINEYSVKIKSNGTLKDIEEAIEKGVKYIEDSNEILKSNNANISEIKYIKKTTPEEEKTSSYEDYIRDMEEKIVPILENSKIDTLRIIKPSTLMLGNFTFPSKETLKGLHLIITEETQKVKKKEQEPEKALEEISEVEEFDKEW